MKIFGWISILAAIGCPVYAVDGVVLINQNSALAGNVTPGDTPGFPVTISVSGSYKLSGNLTVPDADTTAIQITVDSVTIDLNGFSIIGPTVCTGVPVTSCSPSGTGKGIQSNSAHITLFNGEIRGMGSDGISLSGQGTHRIKEIRAFSNGGHGIAGLAIVSSCVSDQNRESGIIGAYLAIGNQAALNGLNGIEFVGVATNNYAFANGGQGINGDGTFNGNTVFANRGAGIRAKCPSAIVSNTASENVGGDIFTDGGGCTRANNTPVP
jgi:hypothetical protein